MSCESSVQLQLRAAPLKPLHRYSAPRPKAGLRAWEEPTLPHDKTNCSTAHADHLPQAKQHFDQFSQQASKTGVYQPLVMMLFCPRMCLSVHGQVLHGLPPRPASIPALNVWTFISHRRPGFPLLPSTPATNLRPQSTAPRHGQMEKKLELRQLLIRDWSCKEMATMHTLMQITCNTRGQIQFCMVSLLIIATAQMTFGVRVKVDSYRAAAASASAFSSITDSCR